MKYALISCALTLAAVSAHAQSQAKFYTEAGYSFIDYEEHDGYDVFKASPKVVRLIGGAELGKNVSVEAMLGFNGGDDTVSYNGYKVPYLKLQLTSMYGFYVKPKMELAPNFEVFGRLGYTNASAKVSVSGAGSDKASDSGFSYGVGASYQFDKKLYVSADYMSYLDKSDYSAKGFTIGLGYKF